MAEIHEVAMRETGAVTTFDELSVEQVMSQIQKIQSLMERGMKRDEHYGVIPGTGTKPTLLKPGAEKLCLMFRLDPQYETREIRDGEHLTVISTCTLYHIGSGARMGSGMGSCSTLESKYAYRKSGRSCPTCSKEGTIIKGKAEYDGGWLCFAKKGGCGAKFKDGDATIESQNTDRVANPDLPDQYNTVLKMGNKRSLVAAVLNVTAASDIFMQDLEDMRDAREPLTHAGHVEVVPDKSAPTDKASPEQRKALMKMASDVLGGKAEAETWIKRRMKDLGIGVGTDTTVAHFQQLTAELLDFDKAGQANVDSFDAEGRPEGMP